MNFYSHSPFDANPLLLAMNGQVMSNQQQDQQANMVKNTCAICSDKASGKHYGVYSCEGCKGFFKRTVRKDLTYQCRDTNECIIDKRQRNRCQACRYQKCLTAGMKREAVQEERQKCREQNTSMNSMNDTDLTKPEYQIELECQTYLDKLLKAEQIYAQIESPIEAECTIELLCSSTEKQLNFLVEWAKLLPGFSEFALEDQVSLLKANWKELLCCCLVYRSMPYNDLDSLVLANGFLININTCQDENFRYLLQRVSQDIVYIMKEMSVDKTELACLKSILLHDPDAKNLKDIDKVTQLRDATCLALSQYCKAYSSNDPSRFAKLLMRLPSMRTWSLKGIENLFFLKASCKFDDDESITNMILNKNL